MQPASGVAGSFGQTVLTTEIPSFQAGLIAFLFIFVLMGIMYYILRSEKNKTIPELGPIGSRGIVRIGNPLSSSEAAYVGIVTMVALELLLDVLIVVNAFQGMGSIALGTMLAGASFLAAVILAMYRSTFMSEAFMRKPRLELITANLSKESSSESAKHD